MQIVSSLFTQWRGQRLPIRKRVLMLVILLGSTSQLGCSYYRSAAGSVAGPYQTEACSGLREVGLAIKAHSLWRQKYKDCYQHHCSPADVKAGFVTGFVDAAMGNNSCAPLHRPSSHTLSFRSTNTAAWYEGYPIGAAAAEACGANAYRDRLFHPNLLALCQNQTCNPGCVPCVANPTHEFGLIEASNHTLTPQPTTSDVRLRELPATPMIGTSPEVEQRPNASSSATGEPELEPSAPASGSIELQQPPKL